MRFSGHIQGQLSHWLRLSVIRVPHVFRTRNVQSVLCGDEYSKTMKFTWSSKWHSAFFISSTGTTPHHIHTFSPVLRVFLFKLINPAERAVFKHVINVPRSLEFGTVTPSMQTQKEQLKLARKENRTFLLFFLSTQGGGHKAVWRALSPFFHLNNYVQINTVDYLELQSK